LTGEELK
jgi:hypothetical protein